MEKSQKINLISLIVFSGFIFSILICFYRGFFLNLDYPYNTFLGSKTIIFSDFTEMMPLIGKLSPYSNLNPWLNYFPFMYLILFPFSLIKPYLFGYIIFAGVFVLIYTFLGFKFLKCDNLNKFNNLFNIITISFLSYPFLFILNRGNADMILFPLFVAVIYFIKKNDYIKSAIFLSMLCAAKPYFVVFLLLFLKNKKFKEFFICIFSSTLITIFSLLIFKGDIFSQIKILCENLQIVKNNYIMSNNYWGIGFSSSICSALKAFLVFILKIDINIFSLVYKILAMLLTLIIIFGTVKEKIFWKQITLLSLYAYSVPFMVYDYKLLFLLIPMVLFLNSKEKTSFDLYYSIIFALLLIPKNLFITPLDDLNYISLNMFLNPILMVVFIFMIIYEQKYKKVN